MASDDVLTVRMSVARRRFDRDMDDFAMYGWPQDSAAGGLFNHVTVELATASDESETIDGPSFMRLLGLSPPCSARVANYSTPPLDRLGSSDVAFLRLGHAAQHDGFDCEACDGSGRGRAGTCLQCLGHGREPEEVVEARRQQAQRIACEKLARIVDLHTRVDTLAADLVRLAPGIPKAIARRRARALVRAEAMDAKPVG